ncbi:hypothetical protein A4X09_0g7689, partial [Tilletia walkeri]
MLAFFKVKSPMLGLLAILTLQLLSIVAGSTLDFFDENEVEAPGLFGRAVGGKYVGSTCTTNIDCYSENCAPTNGTTKLTCQRQPTGGPCFKNSNCSSRNCANTCQSLSNTFGICKTRRDCKGGRPCVDGICKHSNNGLCQSDRACASGRCFNGVCRDPPSRLPGGPCNDSSECVFGSCMRDPFPGIEYSNCERYPLGHSCVTSNQCADGSCKNGLCAKSQIGDDCLKPSQCPGESLCGPDKKCYIPSDRTVYSNDFCKTDEQCTSNRCSTTESYPVCGLLDNGASGCRTFRDCLTGLCQDGTCKLGKDGDRCIANYMCETGKLCGYDGVCYTPDGPQEKDAVCNDNKDCRLGNCVFYSRYRKVRPSLDVPTDGVVSLDGNCDGLPLDAACSSTDDCAESACLGGVCKKVPNGGRCTTSEQCDSVACVDAPGGTYKTCSALLTGGAFCTENDQCFSGNCLFVCSRESVECNYYDPTYKCEEVRPAGTCRIQADCGGAGGAKVCTEDKICKWQGYFNDCTADIDCLSGFCDLSRGCLPADLATSSSEMSMTTASATSTSTTSTTSTSTTSTSTTSTTTSVISSISSTTSTSASATPTISETAAPSTSSTASVEKPTSANKTATTTTTSTTTARSTTSSV